MAEKKEFTNQLLREAIADAEAVRQTAIENAKLSLEETFAPQVKEMIARRLQAATTETPFEDGQPEGSSEMPADTSAIGASDNKEPSDDSFDTADDDMSGEAPADSANDWYEDWSDSDFDLDEVIAELDLSEVIAELEEDVNILEGDSPFEKSYDGDEEEGDEEYESSDEEGEEEEGEGEEESDDEEGEEEGEHAPADAPMDPNKGAFPTSEPAGMSGMGSDSPEGTVGAHKFTLDEFMMALEEAGFSLEEIAPVAPVAPVAPMAAVAEEQYTLQEMLSILEADDAQLETTEPSEQMTSEVQSLQEQLAEYREAFEFLRGKLTEVNLLNAKLLFTNKIFRKQGLTNEQKVTIVENFDRATTVREVKMVYAVLAETLTAGSQKSSPTRSTKKVVAEGFASKPTASTAPKTDSTEILTEQSAVAARFKQLAGIL